MFSWSHDVQVSYIGNEMLMKRREMRMKGTWKDNERKWEEMKGEWKEHDRKWIQRSGFWYPLTSFDTSFGRRSKQLTVSLQNPTGKIYMWWITGVPIWHECFLLYLIPLWRCFGSCVHKVFPHLSHSITCQNRVCRTSASHWGWPCFWSTYLTSWSNGVPMRFDTILLNWSTLMVRSTVPLKWHSRFHLGNYCNFAMWNPRLLTLHISAQCPYRKDSVTPPGSRKCVVFIFILDIFCSFSTNLIIWKLKILGRCSVFGVLFLSSILGCLLFVAPLVFDRWF